ARLSVPPSAARGGTALGAGVPLASPASAAGAPARPERPMRRRVRRARAPVALYEQACHGPMQDGEPTKLTLWQRMGMRALRRKAGRREGEPLEPEDWEVMWRLHEYGFNRAFNWLFFTLPRSPRCGVCGAPFAGIGRWVA